jgi:hypothetical protein
MGELPPSHVANPIWPSPIWEDLSWPPVMVGYCQMRPNPHVGWFNFLYLPYFPCFVHIPLCSKTQRVRLPIQPRPKLSRVKSQWIIWLHPVGIHFLMLKTQHFPVMIEKQLVFHVWIAIFPSFIDFLCSNPHFVPWSPQVVAGDFTALSRLGSARCEAREPSQRRMAPEAWRKEESSVKWRTIQSPLYIYYTSSGE